MKIVELSDIKNIPVSFTLGSFDGLHKGHFVLLSELKQSSVRTNSKSLVISFYPHPRRIVDSDYNLELLNDKSEKLRILNEIGIDYIHFIDFTKEFSKISYKDFYENYIFINLDVKEIIVGSNHGFGMNRDGNKDILSEMCKNHSVKFISVEPLVYKDRSISSTRIRKSLSEGNIEDANEMLGYEYDLGGTVEKGKGLGRKINFPTANIILNRTDKVIPNTGVYFSAIRIKEDLFFGITNIGLNPTVGNSVMMLESHIFDFNEDIYGKEIRVSFIKRIRDEIRFPSVQELKMAIEEDFIKAKQIEKDYRANR